MEIKIFEEYRKVKDQLAALDKLKDELELQIMDALDDDGLTQRETAWGQFCIMGRKTYEYSPAIKELATELSKKKKIEELDGTALLKSDSRHLRLVIPKEKKNES